MGFVCCWVLRANNLGHWTGVCGVVCVDVCVRCAPLWRFCCMRELLDDF